MGSIYKRGNTWWIKYYRNGKYYRESSQSTKKMVAKKLLDRREGEIAQGKLPSINFDNIFFEQLSKELLRDYRINQKKSLDRAERSVAQLNRYFEGFPATKITTPLINGYIEKRLDEGAANATINRELAALKRMLNIGARQTPPLVDRLPHINMLREDNIRTGFFEHAEFMALLEYLPDFLKAFTIFAYKYGCRISEIRNLTWNQIDRENGYVRLDPGKTKNNKGRNFYMDDEMRALIHEQWERRKQLGILVPYVFPNRGGDGQIKDIRGSWYSACRKAGIGKKLFHDLRRTAVRNMVRAGISRNVAMRISGHKTNSVFDRYDIVNYADLKDAARKIEKYKNKITGTISGTIVAFDKKKGSADFG